VLDQAVENALQVTHLAQPRHRGIGALAGFKASAVGEHAGHVRNVEDIRADEYERYRQRARR